MMMNTLEPNKIINQIAPQISEMEKLYLGKPEEH